jgi:hypothetical protein
LHSLGIWFSYRDIEHWFKGKLTSFLLGLDIMDVKTMFAAYVIFSEQIRRTEVGVPAGIIYSYCKREDLPNTVQLSFLLSSVLRTLAPGKNEI